MAAISENVLFCNQMCSKMADPVTSIMRIGGSASQCRSKEVCHLGTHLYCLSVNSVYCIVRFSVQFTSRGQHLSLNNFYTHKNLISTTVTIL